MKNSLYQWDVNANRGGQLDALVDAFLSYLARLAPM